MRNLHAEIKEIYSKLGITKDEGKKLICYSGVLLTGDFRGTYDYNKGFLHLTVCALPNIKQNKITSEIDILCYIGSIDDGGWEARITVKNLEVASQIVDKIYSQCFAKMKALPAENELNEMLSHFGLIGV